MADRSNRRGKQNGRLEAALAGVLAGLGLAVVNLLVGAIGVATARARGTPLRGEPLWPALLLYVLGFMVAGATLALVAVPLMAYRGGSYLFFILGSAIVFAFIIVADVGFFSSWTAAEWFSLVLLATTFGVGLRFLLGRAMLR